MISEFKHFCIILHYYRFSRSVKWKSGKSHLNTDIKWSKQEACFAHATQVWLAVNHNTSITSGERVRCSKRIARASKLGSCQSNVCNS